MTGKLFFDTNVVVYAYDDTEPTKQAIARDLLRDAASKQVGTISVQVLGEFFHATVVRCKLLTCDMATIAIRALSSLEVVGIDASQYRRRHRVAPPLSASILGCVDFGDRTPRQRHDRRQRRHERRAGLRRCPCLQSVSHEVQMTLRNRFKTTSRVPLPNPPFGGEG